MTTTALVFPMQAVWRFCFLALGALGVVALGTAGVELLGVVDRGAVLGEASDVERVAAVVFGAAVLPFAWTAWQHARLELTDDALRFLRFGFLCRTGTIPLERIRRWGTGHETSRGYRHRVLLLELDDRSRPALKLEMYRDQGEFLKAFEASLGPPTPVRATFAGVAFEEE